MPDFPAFVKSPANFVASSSKFTEDVEGYVFDGADGSQVALWAAHAARVSIEHAHDFDEYVLVIEGQCVLVLGDRRIELRAGQEFVIPTGTRQRMEVSAGTRTMHVFGGRRARREADPVADAAGAAKQTARRYLSGSMVSTQHFAEHFAEEWIAAWNAHDLPRVLSHYEDDFEMASPRIIEIAGEPSGVLRGKASVGAYWERALRIIPDLRFEKLGVFVGTRSIAIHYRNQAGRLAVETFEIGDGGRVIRSAAHYA